MPFKALKSYIISTISDKASEENYNFENSFQEVIKHSTSHEEAVILLVALVPHVLPDFFDEIIKEIYPDGGELSHFGGVRQGNHKGFQPTGETLQYILAKNNTNHRLDIQAYFFKTHWFHTLDILTLESVSIHDPKMCGRILLSQNALSLLIFGEPFAPEENINFPAHKISTNLSWDELILPEEIKTQVEDIILWEKSKSKILNIWGQNKFIKNGYRCLFYGASGTGKTLTASLIGKELSKILGSEIEVYRIDLTMVVSKYIGETEKNLENLFKQAENKNWILFFDEGEQFFSSRTSIRDAHDKYANQEVSYLLQRIENYNGIIIVASNLKTNIDAAFSRRFQSMIEFPKPDKKHRKLLWEIILPAEEKVLREEALVENLYNFEITGGNIVNVVQYACLKASNYVPEIIKLSDCITGIKRELAKEGRTL